MNVFRLDEPSAGRRLHQHPFSIRTAHGLAWLQLQAGQLLGIAGEHNLIRDVRGLFGNWQSLCRSGKVGGGITAGGGPLIWFSGKLSR